jgi:hypothetical protein
MWFFFIAALIPTTVHGDKMINSNYFTTNWHDVFNCVKSGVSITSPTLQAIKTSARMDHAAVECLAACQALDGCEHWTLDVENQKCELKENNTVMVQSGSAISGDKSCPSYCAGPADFWCNTTGCDQEVSLNISDTCDDTFTLSALEGDFGAHPLETMAVFVNNRFKGYCDPGSSYMGSRPSWYKCGVYDVPADDLLTVMLVTWDFVSPKATHHGVPYTIYGRVTVNSIAANDYFATAARCPSTTQMKKIRDCHEVVCGYYCFADGTLPDGNTKYNVSNCVGEGQNFNIFIRLCSGSTWAARSPSSVPSRYHTTSPTVHPTNVPTNSPTTDCGGGTFWDGAHCLSCGFYNTNEKCGWVSTSPLGFGAVDNCKSACVTVLPTTVSVEVPSQVPTVVPILGPSSQLTLSPTVYRTFSLSSSPTRGPISTSKIQPSMMPMLGPNPSPTVQPTIQPMMRPTRLPTRIPTSFPTETLTPKKGPNHYSTRVPTEHPTFTPTPYPTEPATFTLTPYKLSLISTLSIVFGSCCIIWIIYQYCKKRRDRKRNFNQDLLRMSANETRILEMVSTWTPGRLLTCSPREDSLTFSKEFAI